MENKVRVDSLGENFKYICYPLLDGQLLMVLYVVHYRYIAFVH